MYMISRRWRRGERDKCRERERSEREIERERHGSLPSLYSVHTFEI